MGGADRIAGAGCRDQAGPGPSAIKVAEHARPRHAEPLYLVTLKRRHFGSRLIYPAMRKAMHIPLHGPLSISPSPSPLPSAACSQHLLWMILCRLPNGDGKWTPSGSQRRPAALPGPTSAPRHPRRASCAAPARRSAITCGPSAASARKPAATATTLSLSDPGELRLQAAGNWVAKLVECAADTK